MQWGDFNVCSDGFVAGLRASGACVLSPDVDGRRSPKRDRQEGTKIRDIALGQPNWPVRATQIGNCFKNQFEMPVLFYVLIALALPLRHVDLVIVSLSWIFVLTRFVHAGIFVTSNDLNYRSLGWFAGVIVVFAMWVYFALKILL